MSCFAKSFPLLGTTEYPQAPFAVAKVSLYWVQQNTLRTLLHLGALEV
jgi:GDP-D-mannose dehydratase